MAATEAAGRLPEEIIRRKRDRLALQDADLASFASGLADGAWSDAQAGAFAMAVYLNGLSRGETVALTRAMTASGQRLSWPRGEFGGPVLDKHSTGGVGDKVSLMLAPILAACGAVVPMISGRGLGHTGGTLDKLEAIPGYRTSASAQQIRDVVRAAGCVIVGQTQEIAPADRRLYALRHLTATVPSIPLIVSSILSKKLAAGLDALVLDVKTGNGALMEDERAARELAHWLVQIAAGAGLRSCAWLTDMSQVLGHSCGNAVEVLEAVQFLRGERKEARLLEITRALCAQALVLGGLAADRAAGLARADAACADGSALEHFARMVAAGGGPADFVERAVQHLGVAPVQWPVRAPRAGWVDAVQAKSLALAVLELGGGRRREGEVPDPHVGLTRVAGVGQRVESGDVLAVVHARTQAQARQAGERVMAALPLADAPVRPSPVLLDCIEPEG